MEKSKSKDNEYNYGIDLLRLIVMFLVVVQHVLDKGGVLEYSNGLNNSIAWFMEICSICAVDCFAIISGYVCYSSVYNTFNYKFLGFWEQVFTYSFGITIICFLVFPESISIKNLVFSIVPIASRRYWYASVYVGLYFLMPWINKLIGSCTKHELSQLVFVISMVFVVYVTFANKVGDAFSMRKGYSLIWIIILYIVGAWMNRCNIMKCFKIRELLMGLIICILFTWAVKILAPQIIVGDMLVNYTSFTIVYNAIALVGIFSKIKLKLCVKKVVAWLKPATFGVYLIHAHPLIFEYLIEDAFSLIAYSSWWLLVVYVLLYSFGIFMVCLVIEMCRLSIFKLLKINKLTEIIDSRIVKQINRKMEIIIGEEQNDYI